MSAPRPQQWVANGDADWLHIGQLAVVQRLRLSGVEHGNARVVTERPVCSQNAPAAGNRSWNPASRHGEPSVSRIVP